MKRFGALPAILLGAVLLRVVAGVGFANYDTLYALVWGQQLARGETPQYGIPVAPTPHPLVEALGFILSPLGPRATQSVTVAIAFIALSALGWVVYRLGALWFGRAAGALAALLLLTRVPVVSYGVRAYIDVPYLVLVLGARAPRRASARGARGRRSCSRCWRSPGCCARRRGSSRASTGSTSPLARGAGAAPRRSDTAGLARLALLACAAPLAWVLSDWLVTGQPLWSLTNTRATARELERVDRDCERPRVHPPAPRGNPAPARAARRGARRGARAAVAAPPLAPRRCGRSRGGGGVRGLRHRGAANQHALRLPRRGRAVHLLRRRRVRLDPAARRRPPAAAVDGGRCGGGARAARLRPRPVPRLHHELDALARQQSIQRDLVALVHSGAISLRCGPVGVPNHRPIPLLALELKTSPADVVSAQARTIARGTYVQPASAEVKNDYILDLHDPGRLTATVPPGFALAATNRSWLVYRRCVGLPVEPSPRCVEPHRAA